MSCGSNNGPAEQLAASQLEQKRLTDQAVNSINTAFAGFTPQFYQNRTQAYENYAMPQVGQQFRQNQQGLIQNLGDRGLLRSSAALQGNQALQNANTQATQQVANQGLSQSQQLQSQVANQQAQLYGQAQTASDPSAIASSALATASGFTQPSAFTPIGNLFNNFASQYLAGQNQQTYSPYQNPYLYAGFNSSGGGGGGGIGFNVN